MLSSLARAVGPALGGVIFGWGVEDGAVGLVWWGYLTVISLVGLGWSWMLREGERPVEKRGREEGDKEEGIELIRSRDESERRKEGDEKGIDR